MPKPLTVCLPTGVSCQGAQSSGPPGLPLSFPPPRPLHPTAAICCKKSQAGQGLLGPLPPPAPFPPAATAAGLGARRADCLLKTLLCVDPRRRPYRVCWLRGSTHPACPLRMEPQHSSSDCVIFILKVGGVFPHFEPRVCDRRLDEGFRPLSPQHPVSRHLWVRVSVSPLTLLLQHHSLRVLVSSALKGRLPG